MAPYQLDARRCISYLTIEHAGSIPEELRPLLGNRVYGCDDCQLVCPWNRFAQASGAGRLPCAQRARPRHARSSCSPGARRSSTSRLEGSAIRRIGYERWLRNLAVGLGNAPGDRDVLRALDARRDDRSALVREHVAWAIAQQIGKLPGGQMSDR